MMDRRALSIFAIILSVTTVAKLLGLSLRPVVVGYEQVASTIMVWLVPSLLSEVYQAGVKTLIIYIPLIFLVNVVLFVVRMIYLRRRHRVILREEALENCEG